MIFQKNGGKDKGKQVPHTASKVLALQEGPTDK